jgi:ferredoxin
MLAIAYLAWVNGRVYCNTICPVGSVLGAVSHYSLFKIRFDNDLCNSCGSCGRQCKASCINTKAHEIDYSRCINCCDCLEVCSQSAMKFSFTTKSKSIPSKNVDASKRRFMLAVGVSTVAATKLLADKKLIKSSANQAKRTTAISPPGSISAQNLMNKCTSCHLCVSKCPSHVIKPSFTEYGLAGIMQPMLSFENGFCNYDCTLCADVCPSGALTPLSLEQKHLNQMGKVQFVHENCIVVTDETNCGACSEHCPTQAVSMIDYKDDLTIPFIKTEICVGCGGCEYVCPAKPNKAIFVEGIDKHNSIVLKKEKVVDVQVDDFGF